MSALAQVLDDFAADQPGAADDYDLHGCRLSLPVGGRAGHVGGLSQRLLLQGRSLESVEGPSHAPPVARPGSPSSACRSSLRELISSLGNTLCRWYSTVRGLMNSWAPISELVSPSRASRAISASSGVSRRGVSAVRLRAVSPVADSSRWACSANPSAPN